MEQNKRIIGVDIVKTCAIFFVIAQHFYLANTTFKDMPFEGFSMVLHSYIMNIFLMGVPLFLLATGYLNAERKISKTYFIKIFRVLISYVLFSVITLIFRFFYLNEAINVLDGVKMILAFNAIPYGWYIEMWIGLFLLTPFLNVLYKGLSSPKEKQILLTIIYLCTALPLFTNRNDVQLFPDFWKQIWPLFYYFAGLYIREYGLSLSSKVLFGIVAVICAVNPILNLMYPGDHVYLHLTGDYIVMMPMAIAFFTLCTRIHTKSSIIDYWVTKISILSLDMYLCCWIFDKVYYPLLFSSIHSLLLLLLSVIPCVVITSFILAQMKDWIFSIGKN